MNSEKYTLGYGTGSVALMALRTAESHAEFFLRRLKHGMSLLDIGCGPGTVTLGFAQAVYPGKVVGAELELAQTRRVAEEAQEQGLNLTFETADIYQLPYPDEHFDAAFLSAVIGNLRHPISGLREVLRVLKPGGFVGVKEFDHSGDITFPTIGFQIKVNELYDRLRRKNGHDPDSGRKVRSYLSSAGFTDIEALATYQNTTPPAGTTGSPIMESLVRRSGDHSSYNSAGPARRRSVIGSINLQPTPLRRITSQRLRGSKRWLTSHSKQMSRLTPQRECFCLQCRRPDTRYFDRK